MGIFRVLRNDMTLIYLNNTIQNVILNIVLINILYLCTTHGDVYIRIRAESGN